jgi:hypothetical protein
MNRVFTVVENLTMETPPGSVETGANAGCESQQDHRELQPCEISALLVLMELGEFADEGLELIEMRYQQALALLNLQDLFSEGQLDGM